MSDGIQTTTATRARVLIVGDDSGRNGLAEALRRDGYEVVIANTAARAKDCLAAGVYDLLIADVGDSGGDCMDLLRCVRRDHDDVPVIVISSSDSVGSAVEAMKGGAYDYLTRPLRRRQLRRTVSRAVRQGRLPGANRQLEQAIHKYCSFEQIVSQDPRMSEVFDLVDAVSDTPTTVLVTGESGTGKSLIARTIHVRSTRSAQPFVEVACGALPDTLLASELFGHVRGAFTDAVSDKEGKFAAADGGTIFLDEVATASPHLQVKLLRVLQDRQFEPVGSNATRQIDVRVVLATNHNLWAEVQAGRFRQDLYYRINVVNIHLPALRERAGDIPLLAEYFLLKYAPAAGKTVGGFTPEATELMRRYDWPGNVRELENCVERAVVLCRGEQIRSDDLPPVVLGSPAAVRRTFQAASGRSTLAASLAGSEKQIIESALASNGGNRKATAAALGINRATLYKKMRKHGLMR